MNSAVNNEMALRYYCAIKTIGWNKPENKLEQTSLFTCFVWRYDE